MMTFACKEMFAFHQHRVPDITFLPIMSVIAMKARFVDVVYPCEIVCVI